MMALYAPLLGHYQPQGPTYDNLALIPRLPIPVLIIHGQNDEIIPLAMGQRLFAAAPEPKELYIIPRAHHNDTYLTGGDDYFVRLHRFIHYSQLKPK
jgi:hypothetical protein